MPSSHWLAYMRRRRQPGVFAPQPRASSDSESPASASSSSDASASASSDDDEDDDDEDTEEDEDEDDGSYDSSASSSSDLGRPRPRLRWQPPPPPPAWAARARKVQPHGSPDAVQAASAVVPVSRVPLAQRLEGSAITVLSTHPALADDEDDDEDEDEVYDSKPFVRGRDRWIHRGRPVGQGDATS